MSLYHYTYTLDGSWGGWWWDGWRVHGMGEWVVGWVVGEFMGWVVGGFLGWVGVVVVGWMVGGFIGWVHIFMNTHHPPIEHIQNVTLSLYIYFRWFMGWVVDGGGVVGGFMGWMGVWWDGWLESSWGGLVCGVGGGGVYGEVDG